MCDIDYRPVVHTCAGPTTSHRGRGEARPTGRRSRTGAPGNKGVGDVGTGPNSPQFKNRTEHLGHLAPATWCVYNSLQVQSIACRSLKDWDRPFVCMHDAARVKFANRSGTERETVHSRTTDKGVLGLALGREIADCEMLGLFRDARWAVSPGGRAFRCRSACGSPCAAAVSLCEIFCNLFYNLQLCRRRERTGASCASVHDCRQLSRIIYIHAPRHAKDDEQAQSHDVG